MGHTVTRRTVAHLGAPTGPSVPLVLTYHRDQPWEITARFLDGADRGAGVVWVFARDLLALGLHAPVGEGDVHVRPAPPLHLAVELDNGHDGVTFHIAVHAVAVFLDATAHLVPFGTESTHTDLDTLCHALRRTA